MPKVEPNFKAPFLGFTRTAEIWNSRACMIGIIGVFIVELVRHLFCISHLAIELYGKTLAIELIVWAFAFCRL